VWGCLPHPTDDYDKKTQGGDMVGVLDRLKIGNVDRVTHDIGNMVGYAFGPEHPDRMTKFILMDAPLPSVVPWEEVLKSTLLWHFRFGGPDMEDSSSKVNE
jgi:pimeloyl-ACP methyl ester carboxylesterase